MLRIVLIATLTTMLTACPKGEDPNAPDKDWPAQYQTWKKVNAETLIKEDEGVAREIYANSKPDLGVGTVLVKEQYKLAEGAKGALTQVAVMKREAAEGPNNGWVFKAFDPNTKKAVGDATACLGCHSLQAENNFVFSPKESL